VSEPAHLQRLNPQQYQAVTTTEGPLLILAGAGSGKTRVLTRRIAHLISLGVDPDQILAVTFTKKAAMEMRERVVELAGGAGEKVWMSTFHSACVKILRQDIEELAYTRKFAIYDDDDQVRMVRAVIDDLGYDREALPARSVLGRIDWFKNRMFNLERIRNERRTIATPVLRIWEAYENALKAADALDFNDLIGTTVRLLEEHESVREKWRDQFRYIMVDEYQDTNRAQYRLLRALADGHRNLAVVGDDDQSIYGFRGADVSIIRSFGDDYTEATIIRMEQNYRSTANILAVSNAVVEKNVGRIDKTLRTDTEAGKKVHFLKTVDPRAEAELVARALHQLHKGGWAWRDMSIIYRTNATARTFERSLLKAGVPYHVHGGQSLWNRREVRDVLSYLRLIANQADDAAFLRIINVPPRGCGTATVGKVRKEAVSRGEPLLKTARALANGAGREAAPLKAFAEMMDKLLDASQTLPSHELLNKVMEWTGYRADLESEPGKEGIERLGHLVELTAHARAWRPEAPLETQPERLRAWLDAVTMASTVQRDGNADEVTLMTVHSSKGLEFPVVFAVHMMEGSFPHTRAEEEGTIDEERRLAYVAFTRAQKVLIISRSENAVRGKGRQAKYEARAPSRFLYGLPSSVCHGELPAGDPLPDSVPVPKSDTDKVSRFLQAEKTRVPMSERHKNPPEAIPDTNPE